MPHTMTQRDTLIRLTLMGGQARAMLCDTTRMTQQARDIHKASNVCTAALGRMISGAAMLGAQLKGEGDTLTCTINGGGPAGALVAVARPDGVVKVTIDNPQVELPLKENGKLDVGGALGHEGRLTVMRSMGFGEPYVGQVNLVSGEVAEDFAMYYTASEQTPSLCALGTLVARDVCASGGLLVQAMPGCTEELIGQLEIRSELYGAISSALCDMPLSDLVQGYFRGLEPEVLETAPLRLACDCSRERIEQVLLSMGEQELQDLIAQQGGAEVGCHFCRSQYRFTAEELEKLIEEGKKRL